jgi:hypothetical protein
MLYRLICERDVTFLEEQVENYLKDGWELYGHPFADETYLYQAVIFKGDIK